MNFWEIMMILLVALTAFRVDDHLENRIDELEKRLSDFETKDQQKYQ